MNYLVYFLIMNAVFWGLAYHNEHCELVGTFGVKGCPPHYIHLLMGLFFYMLAVYIQNKPYIDNLL